MKNSVVVFILVVLAASGGLIYNAKTDISGYPGSELVFKKYYPENEILGMAHDKHWRQIRISHDSIEKINQWYDQTQSHYTLVENRRDAQCSHKSWQQGDAVKLRAAVCDHKDYRTILTITSPNVFF